MNINSLKNFKAEEIFKNVENKLKNNDAITDADITALQLITYTSYTEPPYKILALVNKLLEEIGAKHLDINEKKAKHILLDILSANMLTEDEYKKYTEETNMSPYPGERFYYKKGKEEERLRSALEYLEAKIPIKTVAKVLKISEEKLKMEFEKYIQEKNINSK